MTNLTDQMPTFTAAPKARVSTPRTATHRVATEIAPALSSMTAQFLRTALLI